MTAVQTPQFRSICLHKCLKSHFSSMNVLVLVPRTSPTTNTAGFFTSLLRYSNLYNFFVSGYCSRHFTTCLHACLHALPEAAVQTPDIAKYS